MIPSPGIYNMPAAEYHLDPCFTPSLASHTMHTILTQSPWHAWHETPRLNPHWKPKEASRFDYGAALHKLVLEGEDRMQVIRAKDYQGGDARNARDAARAAGLLPVLEHEYLQVFAMREQLLAAWSRCKGLKGVELGDGMVEQSLFWEHGASGVWCRARPDFMTNDRQVMVDLKFTSGSANPDSLARHILAMGYDLQNVHYEEGNMATGGPAATRFVFAVQETDPPFAASFVGLPPEFLEYSRSKHARARAIFAECVHDDYWPGYPGDICWLTLPGWAATQWEAEMQAAEVGGANEGMERMYGDIRRDKEGLH